MTECEKTHGPGIKPSKAGVPWSGNQCRLCWRELNLVPSKPAIAVHSLATLTCEHRGDPLLAAECQKLGLDPSKQWHPCEHPEKPLGPYVCPCKGCNSTCRGYALPDLVSVNLGAGGLGDALLASCAIKGYARRHTGKNIIYKINNRWIPFLRLFDAGYYDLAHHDWDDCADLPKGAQAGDVQMNMGYAAECMTKAAITRIGRWCRNLGGVTPERPPIRDRQALLDAAPLEHRGAVLLAPFSTWHTREYPIHGWLTVERQLLELGYRVLTLDARDARFPNRHQQMRGEKLIDAPADVVAGLMLHSPCVISNDSGLAHLAGMLDVPSLVLLGQTTYREIFAYYGPHVRHLSGHLDCAGCYWQMPFNSAKCEPVCPNLASNSPDEIVAAVTAIAGPPRAGRVSSHHLSPGETGKAHDRRVQEGWFEKYIRAPAIDIGCGRDPLVTGWPVQRWDHILGNGDATVMAGVPDDSYAAVVASHILEHLQDPVAALRRWHALVKPGGYLIVCVPSKALYEKKETLPSRWNGDHKWFWDLENGLPGTVTRGLRETALEAIPGADIVSLRTLDSGYISNGPDQHSSGEYSFEIIIRKPD